MVSNSQ